MHKETILNILRVIFLSIIIFLLIFSYIYPKKTETNILRAILSNSSKDELVINLSQKFSGRLNVIFESTDIQKIEEVKKAFKEQLCADAFKKDVTDTHKFKELLNTYKYYNANLLSPKTRTKLRHGDFEEVKLESMERLYNPLSINLVPIEEDPFLLFNDFLSSLPSAQGQVPIAQDGKFYELMTLNLKDEIALSPSLLNIEMKKVVDLKDKISKEFPEVEIYLTGSSVHTYSASSRSMIEINIICLLSSVFIILLCKLYFRTFKILIPIALSLFLGMLFGYLTTSAFFESIHILTFVFSTTLIGICVDYSLHYFAHHNDLRAIFKSLTISMLTTVCAFLTLLFSQIELLMQIAVFTSAGLISVYAFVVLFYPVICKKLCCEDKSSFAEMIFSLKIPKKTKIIFSSVCFLIFLAGFFQLSFNDDIKDMYKPSKNLLRAEKIYSSLTGDMSNMAFVIVNGENIEALLEKEEQVTENIPQEQYIALSQFLPSKKQQNENKKLKKRFYQNELFDYAKFLRLETKNKILYEKPRSGFLTEDKLPRLLKESFLASPNQSIIVIKHADQKIYEQLSKDNEVIFIDLKKEISSKVQQCRENCIRIFFPAILALYVLLAIIYKPLDALKITAPSVLGGVFTLSVLGLFHISLNLFHILALFLIIGFSLDYSIFRFDSKNASVESKAAVLISCATTVFSFLLLACTSFKLISSLGLILGLGLISSYLFSLLLINKTNDTE